MRSLISWSKVQDLCNTNILLIYWLKSCFESLLKKFSEFLENQRWCYCWRNFQNDFHLGRSVCGFQRKKKLKFLRHEKIVTLQNWFINLCPFFFFLFFAYWWKKSQQLRKKIMILTLDSEGYCTPISWMNPLTHLCLKQTDKKIEGSNNLTLIAMNRYHISFLK